MTTELQNIDSDFYTGNTKNIECTVVDELGSPKDLTGAFVTFAMFDDKTSVIKLIKTTLDAGITIDNGPGGILTVHLLPANTYNIWGTYRYHINVVDASGNEATVATGRINIIRCYAIRPSKNSMPAYLAGV
jgi:hypothetical protein